MARPKKIGNEICPDRRCEGYMKLGRIRQKTVRSRPTGSYIYRSWFRHNDSKIPEHYVDNFVRSKEYEKKVGLKISEEYLRIGHTIDKIGKRIMSFPLNEEEHEWLYSRLNWFRDNILIPLDIISDITTRRLEAPPGAKKELWEIVIQNLYSEDNIFGRGYAYLCRKYDRPMRLERNRIRNAKLSEWHGKRTTDFTGIESESIKSVLKP